jgi:hypothetical protein
VASQRKGVKLAASLKMRESNGKCLKITPELSHEGACRGQRLYMTVEMRNTENAQRGSEAPGSD